MKGGVVELVLVGRGRLRRGRRGLGAAGKRGVVKELVLEGLKGSGSAADGLTTQRGGACRSGSRGVLLAALGAGAGLWYLGAPIRQKGSQHSSQSQGCLTINECSRYACW